MPVLFMKAEIVNVKANTDNMNVLLRFIEDQIKNILQIITAQYEHQKL